ncbi:outer membrane beta-barrel protein [bacterium]|nr:outer membrane beta-barrel protein [bacterium]
MRRFVLLTVAFVLILSVSANAKKSGKLSLGAKMSVYDPPGDASSTLLFEIVAKYWVSTKVTTELSVGWTQYKESGENVMLMPIQLNAEFHPLGRISFDPYCGGGIGAYIKQTGDETSATAGIQMLAGLSFKPSGGLSFNAEVKYILSDITDSNSGGFSFGGGVEGNWQTEL